MEFITWLQNNWAAILAFITSICTTIGAIVTVSRIAMSLRSSRQAAEEINKARQEDLLRLQKSEERYSDVEKENAYLKNAILVNFKCISYLVASSKLPNEDKLSIQKEIFKLASSAPQVKTNKVNATGIVENVQSIVEDVVSITKSSGDLFEKYLGDK